MKTNRRILLVLALAGALSPVGATTIVLPDDRSLVEKSDLIITASVLRSDSVDLEEGIWTESALEARTVLKGDIRAGEVVFVREPGGRIAGRMSVVFGAPEYRAGEEVLVFLTKRSRGGYQTTDMVAGKFVRAAGLRAWHRDLDRQGVSILGGDLESAPSERLRSFHDPSLFEQFVRDVVLNVPTPRNAPVTQHGWGSLSSDFKLIAEPDIHRWFAFEEGRSASWKSVGQAEGYADGGVKELKTAMAVWTGYSAALIRYAYAGAAGGAGGGLTSPNGVNEVMFGDPRQEIPGTWNGSDGVVGAGGFNAIAGPRPWAAPFSGGPHQQAGARSAFDIIEGNLVIQDGISPLNGISSIALGEILAHELGHTLGIGHSAEPTSLMHASLAGLGPSLRPDDQLAARWLYPNDGSTEEPKNLPPSPADLSVMSIGPDSAKLKWTDRANDESSQTIYYQRDGEAMRKYGDVAANVTMANLTGLTAGKIYRARVTARNDSGESSPSNTAEFKVPEAKLEAAFATAPPTGTARVTIFSFYDQSRGSPVSRTWDLGDGTFSHAANPSHLYQSSGTYTVRLTVKNAGGDESSATSMITVAPPPTLIADFTWSPSLPAARQPIQFRHQTLGSPTTWSWSFGDGTSSTQSEPEKSFDKPGPFTVTLTVSDGLQTSTVDRQLFVVDDSKSAPALVAEFDISDAQPIVGREVTFHDRSSGYPESRLWSFGDGTTSTALAPSHRFLRAGAHEIELRVMREGLESRRFRSVVVSETPLPAQARLPVAAQAPGVGGTEWRTELTLFNNGSAPAGIAITLIPGYGLAPQTRQVDLPAGRTISWQRALVDLFGLENGRGALSIEATSSVHTPQIRIASRTFTESPGGSYGQFVPSTRALPAGQAAWLTDLAWSDDYRTNIGWSHDGVESRRITLRLIDESGADLGSRAIDIPPFSFDQRSLASIFTFLQTQPKRGLSLKVTEQSGRLPSVYASIIDNRSQDPTYLPAMARAAEGPLIVPVVGRAPGAGGTFWRSDLAILNPGATYFSLSVRMLRSGQDNRSARWSTVELLPMRSVTIRDVVGWLGDGDGSGALEIRWDGEGPIVTSRTYTTREDGGTYGQSIDAIEATAGTVDAIITGLRSDSDFRTNLGVVNLDETAAEIHFELLSPMGASVARTSIAVPATSHFQGSVLELFPEFASSPDIGPFTVRSRASRPLFVYGSVVDRRSGDPVFIAGE
ncbi:MAG TPA: PKD domain-containing protein [Thermoanaerobaculia bacterium]|nr:PKD domain-containing protein [Thermoanaerobaculia bacterium]